MFQTLADQNKILRHKVTILQQSDASDSFGQPLPDMGTPLVKDIWASIEPLQGRELYKAQQFVDQVSHKVTIRYLPGIVISDNMNVQFGIRVFRITAVLNPEERNLYLDLYCVERENSVGDIGA